MRGCVSIDRAQTGLLALLAAGLLLGGCADPAAGGRFNIRYLEASWDNGRMLLDCEQQLQLSAEARTALQHGVPLTVELTVILRDTGSQTRVHEETRQYEIRYLPLSEHYRLSDPARDAVQTFPRLRHALAELSRLQLSMDIGPLPAGDYELLVRSRLDHSRMPPPMRLPALFDPAWNHASDWMSWPLTVEAAS
jgi:hypothetical protein